MKGPKGMPQLKEISAAQLKCIVEAALLAADEPLDHNRLAALFDDGERPALADIARALEALGEDCADRGIELKQVASGFRLQVKQSLQKWVSRLWKDRPQRYSRAMLETLSLIAYRQPITRGEIESVRGVSLSSNIIRTMQEREWIRVVGHRDVPGKPALFGTTKAFLDHFDLKSLDDLPALSEIRDLDSLDEDSLTLADTKGLSRLRKCITELESDVLIIDPWRLFSGADELKAQDTVKALRLHRTRCPRVSQAVGFNPHPNPLPARERGLFGPPSKYWRELEGG